MEVKSNISQTMHSFQQPKNIQNQELVIESRLNQDLMEKARHETKEVKKFTIDDIETQLESMNQMMEAKNTGLKFNFHEDLERIYVQVVDRQTDEVIKEIPPEKFLDMVSSMLDFMGLMIDQRI
ncbi:flagellar protein FlaG [Alkalihalobacterium sp. APHAB7]|uniref:flagellar protein FlaG n=1 Tax=Alkalihalobacterium sp. APHAB7 TaxID=3402081 RepID=UPI003AAAE449